MQERFRRRRLEWKKHLKDEFSKSREEFVRSLEILEADYKDLLAQEAPKLKEQLLKDAFIKLSVAWECFVQNFLLTAGRVAKDHVCCILNADVHPVYVTLFCRHVQFNLCSLKCWL